MNRVSETNSAPPGLAIGLALAAVVTAALAVMRLWLIPVHVSFNPNEGWNAFQAARALGAGPLYPPAGALTGDNYPPLSFLIVGALARATGGDLIVVGRVVSLVGVLATAASIVWAVRRLDPGRSQAPAVAALVFLAFNATQFRAYLAMDDPQWLAHALMTPALALLTPSRPDGAPGAVRTAAAALLVVAGGLVKHNLVALPLAATLWLLLHHRRAFAVWAGVGGGAAAAAVAAVAAAYGPDAFRDVLGAPRQTSWVRMARASLGPVLASAPLLGAAAPLIRLRRADRRLDLVLLFIGLAIPLGLLQRSGEGVNFNAHFEALVALSVGAGAALAHALSRADNRAAGPRLAWLAAPFMILVPLAARAEWTEAAGFQASRRAWAAMERRIAGAGGPVACETPALCFWAGQPFVLDLFLYGQRVARTSDASALVRMLETGRIAAVQRDSEKRPKPGDTLNPVLPLLDRRTVPVFQSEDGRWLAVPRR